MNVEQSRLNPEQPLSRHTTLRLIGLGAASAVIPAVMNGCGTSAFVPASFGLPMCGTTEQPRRTNKQGNKESIQNRKL